jgi:cyanate permease
MTKSRVGMLAGIAGAAFAAWWWQQRSGSSAESTTAHERGEVIFSNAPVVDDTIGG